MSYLTKNVRKSTKNENRNNTLFLSASYKVMSFKRFHKPNISTNKLYQRNTFFLKLIFWKSHAMFKQGYVGLLQTDTHTDKQAGRQKDIFSCSPQRSRNIGKGLYLSNPAGSNSPPLTVFDMAKFKGALTWGRHQSFGERLSSYVFCTLLHVYWVRIRKDS